MRMNEHQTWKNFNLGDELSIPGALIYNGLRQFHEMQTLDNLDKIFELLYDLSVGLERLLKIAVVLIEYKDDSDQEELKKSLITHNHLELLNRVRTTCKLNLGPPHNEFLSLLETFYKSFRYDRFMLSSVYDTEREKKAIYGFLSKHLGVEIQISSSYCTVRNEARYRKFIRGIVTKISCAIYEVVQDKASELSLYTYEVRRGSKAHTVFLGQADLASEEVLWKKLLVFFINTKSSSGYLDVLRSIEPLEFDPALTSEYLQCFQSNAAKAFVIDELTHLYEQLENSGERIELMSLVGDPGVYFNSPNSEDDEEDEDDEELP